LYINFFVEVYEYEINEFMIDTLKSIFKRNCKTVLGLLIFLLKFMNMK